MYKNKKILCVIPARSGSKGLPGKNIKQINKKPLLAYTIEHAKKSKYIDRIIVSTESKNIAKIAKQSKAEVPFMRPKHLARDSSGTIDVLLHAIDWAENKAQYNFDILVLLHTTTPLRTPKDIDKSIELLFKKNTSNVFSVTDAHRNPYFNMVEMTRDKKIHQVKKGNFPTRQSAPKVFDMNASIYVWWKDVLKATKALFLPNTRIYVMPKERSIDIDDAFDFKIASLLLKK